MSRRIRVIINDRLLYRPLTGVGHYASQLLRAFGEMGTGDTEIQPFLGAYLRRPRPRPPETQAAGHLHQPEKRPRRRREREWLRGLVRRMAEPPYNLAFGLQARRFDLYHEPNHIPITTAVPTVTTVHDISVLSHPEWHPEHRVRWYERQFERGRRQTTRFIAASEFTKREMVEQLGIAADSIDVTLQAARPEFVVPTPDVVEQARRELGLPERFFLFVGTLEPRKNLGALLEAHAGLPAKLRARYPLVLAGAQGWKNESLDAKLRAKQAAGELRLLGYLSNEMLACLYAACVALVWPSLYEGFGLPPLEAMACGAPVITSAVSAIPEVVGQAGVLLHPHDVPPWTEAMQRMAEDADWRQQWITLGLQRAAMFSWQVCAAQTLACYRKALGLD